MAPECPTAPMVFKEMSLAITRSGSSPFQITRMVWGTFIQVWPVASTPAISVEPTPVANAARAP